MKPQVFNISVHLAEQGKPRILSVTIKILQSKMKMKSKHLRLLIRVLVVIVTSIKSKKI